ncbi:MAG TPA: glycosyltransferase family 2 protein [Ohtaekwangia sp.]|nr:glycosyltransferase family 2 protein [Ohtaekwangia sp.]
MVHPKISIITVVFNGAQLLEETIKSVLLLAYDSIEYIIIDGGSTDGSVEVIDRFKDRISYSISEPDKGIYDAMNKGIRKATGDWINFMNCGDRFSSSDALGFFEEDQFNNVDVIYGDALIKYPTFNKKFNGHDINNFWKAMPFCHQSCFVKSTLMKEYSFDTRYKYAADFEFLYKAYLNDKKFFHISIEICQYDFTQGASVLHSLKSVKERRMIVLKYGADFKKRLYYNLYIGYIQWSIGIKRILGKRLTAWVTRFLNT